MRKMTTLVALLWLGAAMLAGCSAPAATTSPTAGSGAAGGTNPTAGSGAAASGEKATVTVMTWEGEDTNAAIDQALAAFESANPNINVERVPSPNSGYGEKINSMVQSKTLPDIFWAGNDTEQQFGEQGLLFDWSAYIKKGDGLKATDFAPGALENWTSADGKLYGLPTLMNTYGFWYNADMFEKAGVPLPKPGWTYDDMLAAAETLTVKDGANVTRYGVYAAPIDPFAVSNCGVSSGGQPFMDKIINPTKITADDKFVACAQKIATAVQAGNLTPPDFPGDGLTESFIAGQIPMLYFGQWLAPSFIAAKPAFKYGFAPLPIVKDVVQPYDAVGIISPKEIKNPEATWKVAQFLASGAWETVLVGAPVAPAAHVPSSTPYFNTLTAAGLGSVADSVKYELTAPNKQGIRFTAPWSAKANDVLKANWNDILTGKKPLDATMPTMVQQLNDVIKAGA